MDFRVRASANPSRVRSSWATSSIEVTLPWLLAKLADVVRDAIQRRAQVLLDGGFKHELPYGRITFAFQKSRSFIKFRACVVMDLA